MHALEIISHMFREQVSTSRNRDLTGVQGYSIFKILHAWLRTEVIYAQHGYYFYKERDNLRTNPSCKLKI